MMDFLLMSRALNLHKSAQCDPFFPMSFTMQILFLFFSPPTRKKNPFRDSSTIEYTECRLIDLLIFK